MSSYIPKALRGCRWLTQVIIALCARGLNNRRGIPVLIWGQPGIAKSYRLREIAKRAGVHIEVMIASNREPADIAGYPLPNYEKGTMKLATPFWVQRLNKRAAEDGLAILFMDEISEAGPQSQGVCMRVIHDRVVGETPLHKDVLVIAAANDPDEAAGGYELAAPLSNRFFHVFAKPPSAENWISWVLSQTDVKQDKTKRFKRFQKGNLNIKDMFKGKGKGKLKDEEPEDDAKLPELQQVEADKNFRLEISDGKWEQAFRDAKTKVTSFLHSHQGKLHDMPEADADRGKPWPSARSWEMATRLIASAQALGLDTEANLFQLTAGTVGSGVAKEFQHFLTNFDLPKAEDLINGKVDWEPDNLRPDRTFAVMSSLVSYVNGIESNQSRYKVAARVFDIALDVTEQEPGQIDAVTTVVKAIIDDIRNGCLKNPKLMERFDKSALKDTLKLIQKFK